MDSVCIVAASDGSRRCRNRGIIFPKEIRGPIRCVCDGQKFAIIGKQRSCPYGPIVQRLTPEGLAGLDRCRAADCGLMHVHGAKMVCVGRGKSCEWLNLWAAWLNSGRHCKQWAD